VEQVVHVANARHPADRALDALDLLVILELPAEDHDPAVGVDADRPLGNRAIAEQLALDFADKADVVKLRYAVFMVSDRVRGTNNLARLVMGMSLDPARTAAQCGSRAVASEVASSLAAARIEEELQRGARRQREPSNRGQLTR
jgi:hypothetical protein